MWHAEVDFSIDSGLHHGRRHVDLAGLYIPLVNPQRGLEPVT